MLLGRDRCFKEEVTKRLPYLKFENIENLCPAEIRSFIHNQNVALIIISSYKEGTCDGLDSVAEIRRHHRQIPIILITRYSSEARAIAALRAGVSDYLKLPLSYQELLASIKRHLSHALPQYSQGCETRRSEPQTDHGLIGNSPLMQQIRAYLRKVAATDSTVLITGETGTGKELAAKMIHRHSPRHDKPFVCINCAALPEGLLESELFGHERGAFTGAFAAKEGKFELAASGSIFLDEIGDLIPYGQAKILRTIETKEMYRLGGKKSIPVDLRIIAATNQDPERLVAEGKFRRDLYYRLNVARVHLPPLRDRKEDIPPLFDHFMRAYQARFKGSAKGFADEALALLVQYDWPGNIRELKNLVEATLINSPSRWATVSDLPDQFQRLFSDLENLNESELERLLAVLCATNWNKSKAAQKLNWSRMTLYRKMAKYRISSRKP